MCCSTKETIVSSSLLNKAKLWHLRLGHLAFHKLQMIFPDVNEKLVKSNILCTVCPQGKKTRTNYPKSFCKSTKPLGLLNNDNLGPFRYLTRHNYSMFVTFVDDFGRMSWIFLIMKKSNFVDVLKQFVALMEKQLNTHIKCVRTRYCKGIHSR